MSRVVPLVCLVAGVAVMLAFEAPVLRALGVVLLVAFIASGMLVIATPDYLEAEEDTHR